MFGLCESSEQIFSNIWRESVLTLEQQLDMLFKITAPWGHFIHSRKCRCLCRGSEVITESRWALRLDWQCPFRFLQFQEMPASVRGGVFTTNSSVVWEGRDKWPMWVLRLLGCLKSCIVRTNMNLAVWKEWNYCLLAEHRLPVFCGWWKAYRAQSEPTKQKTKTSLRNGYK